MTGLSWLEWVKWIEDAPQQRSFINEDVVPEPETARQRAKRLGWKVIEEQTDE
jgi:hypothetical protein